MTICNFSYIFNTLPATLFTDFSLCDFGFDDCHVNATCIDRVGGYDCLCNDGYTGNGTHCYGISIKLIARKMMWTSFVHDDTHVCGSYDIFGTSIYLCVCCIISFYM